MTTPADISATRDEHVVVVTCYEDMLDHLVTSDDMAQAISSDATDGFRTVCGRRILPAPMVCDPLPCCPLCASRWQHLLRLAAQEPVPGRHGHRRISGAVRRPWSVIRHAFTRSRTDRQALPKPSDADPADRGCRGRADTDSLPVRAARRSERPGQVPEGGGPVSAPRSGSAAAHLSWKDRQ